MGLYDRGTIDIGSAVDYLLDKGYGNYFFPEDLQDISLKDFRLVFLGENSERLIGMIIKNHYKELFNAASRLRVLEECLSMEVEKDEFQGKLSDYLQYRVDRNNDFSKKYIDILSRIQVMQGDGPEVSAQSRQPVDQSNVAYMEKGLNLDAIPPFSEDGQDQSQGGGSVLSYDKLYENQRNLFDKVVEGMKLEYRESLREIFKTNYSEDLNEVLSTELSKDGNVFSILTYCFYEEDIIFDNFYHMIGLADKYQDAFRKLFKEESIIDGKSYTALSYAREQSSRLGGLVERIEQKMRELGLEVPAHEGKLPAGPSDPDYATHLRGTSVLSDNDNTSEKSPTFLDKLSANKGKFTAGTIGASLLIAGIITALVVAKPIVVACAIVAAVLGAIMLGGVALAKTTDKGEKMWDQAGQKLSSLLVSNREQRWL